MKKTLSFNYSVQKYSEKPFHELVSTMCELENKLFYERHSRSGFLINSHFKLKSIVISKLEPKLIDLHQHLKKAWDPEIPKNVDFYISFYKELKSYNEKHNNVLDLSKENKLIVDYFYDVIHKKDIISKLSPIIDEIFKDNPGLFPLLNCTTPDGRISPTLSSPGKSDSAYTTASGGSLSSLEGESLEDYNDRELFVRGQIKEKAGCFLYDYFTPGQEFSEKFFGVIIDRIKSKYSLSKSDFSDLKPTVQKAWIAFNEEFRFIVTDDPTELTVQHYLDIELERKKGVCFSIYKTKC